MTQGEFDLLSENTYRSQFNSKHFGFITLYFIRMGTDKCNVQNYWVLSIVRNCKYKREKKRRNTTFRKLRLR
jgi:hypothetical protein